MVPELNNGIRTPEITCNMDDFLVNNLDIKALFSSIPKPDTYADIASLVLVAASSVAFALRGSAWDKSDPNRAIYFERVQDGQDGLPGAKETRNIHQRLQELVSILGTSIVII